MRGKRRHHELKVWQEGLTLAKEVYRITDSFPQAELFGLSSQMRRAAISIPSNIAEGAARNSPKEFLHFLSISRGSLSELKTQTLLAIEIGFIKKEYDLLERIEHIFGLLGGLINSIREKR
ncbi:MAG: four helix bundle protein [Proteobacteria bacterium]|nr:four helix bundle protein [Pseudomonadota bacterium]MBU1688200.1 four helix bundle protein [Pseudomonadota bacterium]